MFKEKFIMSFILLGLLLNAALPGNVMADPAAAQVSSSNTNLNTEAELEKKIQITDNEIEKNIADLNTYNDKIKSLETDIYKNETNLKDVSSQMQKLNDTSKHRIRAMYMNGMGEGYLDLILSSKNLIDLTDKVAAAQRILSFDKNTLEKLKNDKQDIELKSKNLKNDKESIEKLKGDVNTKISLLNEQKNSEKTLLDQLKSNDSKSLNTINSDNAIVNYAFKFLGIKYVWGGTSPNPGFDCSGFVQYVYSHFGVSIPRLSQDQQSFGTDVPNRESLKPGDLIFFGKPAYHVGMYIGNNEFIQAPHTGDVVKISALGNYTSAKRLK